ncbi:MAG TPA: beta-propeller domain-containing protein [Frankiaceae bacterium]|nr:beta-propeller domain-containing protein [Frankiaceae bacterium]
MRKTVAVVAAGTALLGLGVAGGWAAGASGSSGRGSRPLQATGVDAGTATNAGFTGSLVAFDSCGGLLDALHARARDVVGPYGFSSGVYPGGGVAYSGLAEKSLGTLAPIPQAASSAGSSTDSSTLTHSTTNTQVKGVDEPDLAKTDGRYLISLDGQLLRIVDVRTAKLRATLALPQPGSELLLSGDRVVVLSGATSVGVYPVASGVEDYGPARSYLGYANTGTTAATVIDISNPDAPSVTHRWTFNAGELAARVVNGTIRLVLTSSPPQETWASPRDDTAAEKTRATKVNQEIVDATPLDSWIPRWTGEDGQTHQISACDAVATPAKPSSLSMVTVLSLDPTASRPGAGTSVLGAGNVAYAEGKHLFVSDTGAYPNQFVTGALVPVPQQPQNPTLHLLEFDLSNPAQARYLASGTLTGQLHDSYALSEYQDNLRVTTTTTNASGNTSTAISVLARQGDRLVQIGTVGGLGTGEQVYAVRYVGDRGYVVTFRQIDPLHVVDLSDPRKPVLRGTLTMPGYSSLLLPLSDHRLLGIGREVPSAPSGTIVEPGGLQLSLFDVSDAAHPRLLDRHVLSDTYADAVNDPHAVTISPDGKLVILPSTSGPLAIAVSATRLSTTTGTFTTPYSVQDERTVIAGERLFEVADRGVAVRSLPGLHQTGWIAF